MNAADIQQIFVDIETGERVLQALATFTGLDSTRLLSVAKESLPPLQPAAPDEAAEYEKAKAAIHDTAPAPPPEPDTL